MKRKACSSTNASSFSIQLIEIYLSQSKRFIRDNVYSNAYMAYYFRQNTDNVPFICLEQESVYENTIRVRVKTPADDPDNSQQYSKDFSMPNQVQVIEELKQLLV